MSEHSYTNVLPHTLTEDMRLIEVEASMCVWEAILNMSIYGLPPALREAWDNYGTVTLRWACIYAGPAVNALWGELTPDEQEELIPYDWEFCVVVAHMSGFDGERLVLPTVQDIRKRIAIKNQ